ncbi:HAD-IA family hydrolase [Micromonospora sp. NPDC047134]|uniref:HAD-IA family hydrolase n=1 Tax=Micromonospora sp. NPDC047134 TaxID=3154340 RepID=UPI003406D118
MLTARGATLSAWVRHPEAVRAVIFDLDGVLVDSIAVAREAFRIAYDEVVGDGVAPVDEYCRYPGRHLVEVLRLMGLPATMASPFVRESHRLAGQVRLMPGVIDLLEVLGRRGIPMAVATSKDGVRARTLLDQLGILPVFAHVLGADEVDRPKPAPDIVLRTLALLGIEAPAALMVGDAVADIACARAAGVVSVAATWGETDRATLLTAEPDVVLDHPADLLALSPF